MRFEGLDCQVVFMSRLSKWAGSRQIPKQLAALPILTHVISMFEHV